MKQALAIAIVFILTGVATAQNGMAFYHLRNATFQSTSFNPAYVPKGKVFIGLPLLSGINVFASSPLSYRNLVSTSEGVNTLTVDNAIKRLKPNNVIALNADISLLHLGFQLPNGLFISLFANERIDFNFSVPKKLAQSVWEGNGSFVGERLDFGYLGATGNYFREYGIGAAIENEAMGLKLGARLKYYQGIVNISTPNSMDIDLLTLNQNYQIQLELENVNFRTAGVEVLNGNEGDIGSYLVSNGNRGMGVDVGFEKRLNKYTHFAVSLTDLGFIGWKEGIKNYSLNDTTMLYSGISLERQRNMIKAIQDTLIDRFSLKKNAESYTTMMPTRLLGSYVFTPREGTDIITSAGGRLIQGLPRMMYGVGIRQYFGPKFIISGSVTKVPQQFLNIGAALSATAGVAQLYLAVDKTVGYNVPQMKWVEVRVGINLVFGSGKPKSSSGGNAGNKVSGDYKDFKAYRTEPKGVVTSSFMGSGVKVKKQDGLYTIVKKQEPSEAKTITPEVINNDRENKKVESASATARKNDREIRKVQSATGKAPKNNYEKSTIKTGTSSAQKPSKIKKKPSRAGSQSSAIKNDSKKSAPRSASGQNRNHSSKKRKRG
jgi:hypothetical protein